MGEIPIFTSKAHVFVIDPETKKSWIPSSQSLVQVNFFFDSSRNTYRIISVEGSKAIINSTVVPEMNFTKTSGKFGQWADIQAGIVYGLGFSTDLQLANFCEQFEAIREKSQKLKIHLRKSENQDNEATGKKAAAFCNVRSGLSHDTSPSNKESDSDPQFSSKDGLSGFGRNSLQLSRPDSCENELNALKVANKKLTATLQDTMASANEWLKKMNSYKDDCDVKQTKINELEDEKNRLSQSVGELVQKNESLAKKNKEISQECSLLQQRIEVLSVMEAQHDQCAARIKSCLEETQEVEEEKKRIEEKLEQAALQRKSDVTEVRKCCAEIAAHLTIITETTQRLQSTM